MEDKFYCWDKFLKVVRPIKSAEREMSGTTVGTQLGFVGSFDASCCGMFFAFFGDYLEAT